MYRSLDDKLAVMDNGIQDLTPLPEDMRNEAFQTICEVAQSMDYGMTESVAGRLSGIHLPCLSGLAQDAAGQKAPAG